MTASPHPNRQAEALGVKAERRIARLTLAIGGAAAAIAAIRGRGAWAAGLLAGTGLAWLNFRLLRRALDALLAASTAQAGREKPQVPGWTYFAAACRYGLIGLAVYVIFRYFQVPLLSLVAGLCALGAAAMAASVYEILHGAE